MGEYRICKDRYGSNNWHWKGGCIPTTKVGRVLPEQQPRDFFKSLDQVRIFPPALSIPSLPLHGQRYLHSLSIPLLPCLLLPLSLAAYGAGGTSGVLLPYSSQAAWGAGSAGNSSSSVWVPPPWACCWADKEHLVRLDQEQKSACCSHQCYPQLNLAPYAICLGQGKSGSGACPHH